MFLGYANQLFGLLAVSEIKPTYFELLVAMAYWVFAKEKVDYAVIAFQKAGIIHPHNTVFIHHQSAEIIDVVMQSAKIAGLATSRAKLQVSPRETRLPTRPIGLHLACQVSDS